MTRLAVLLPLAAVLLTLSAQAQTARLQVPVMIGGDPDLDACGSVGLVKGLDARRDGFLAVKAAPDLNAPRIDKVRNGQTVVICEIKGDWYGIVYSLGKQDCKVSSPAPLRRPYSGPCRSGWSHKRWINPIAG